MAAVIAAAGCASPSPWSISQAARPTGESAIPYIVCVVQERLFQTRDFAGGKIRVLRNYRSQKQKVERR